MTQADLEPDLCSHNTCKSRFRDEMERVVPVAQLHGLIEAQAPRNERGREPLVGAIMLLVHFLQQKWFGLSDVPVEGALFNVPLHGQCVGLSDMSRRGDRVSIRRFPHRLGQNDRAPKIVAAKGLMLQGVTEVNALLIAAPSSTKDDSGQAHAVEGTAADLNEVNQAHALVRGDEADVFAHSGYQCFDQRGDTWDIGRCRPIALRRGLRRVLEAIDPKEVIAKEREQVKARICPEVEYPFRVITREFFHVKVRYRGVARKTAHLHTLFALPKLCRARRPLMAAQE